MLDLETLADKSFLDIGSGSGFFSLAAKKLCARGHYFDYVALLEIQRSQND
jgi:2-polyprenyl-6-hydroxyphenyl methylase/3-demethylubiquinone-9 3-methyltransferase